MEPNQDKTQDYKTSDQTVVRRLAEANRLWRMEERIRRANASPEVPKPETPPNTKPGNVRDFVRRAVQLGTFSDFPDENQFDAVARQFDVILGGDVLRQLRTDRLKADFEELTPDQQVAVLAWNEGR